MILAVLATHTGEHSERVALYTVVGAVMVALVGVLGVWLQVRANGRAARAEHAETRSQVAQVYEHVNNVELGAEVPDGDEPMTLGRLVRKIERKIDAGFEQNEATHEAIVRVVEAQGETIHDHGRRIDQHRVELDELRSAMEPPKRKV